MDKTLHHSTNNIHENWFTGQIPFSITVHTGNIGDIHNLGYWMGMEGHNYFRELQVGNKVWFNSPIWYGSRWLKLIKYCSPLKAIMNSENHLPQKGSTRSDIIDHLWFWLQGGMLIKTKLSKPHKTFIVWLAGLRWTRLFLVVFYTCFKSTSQEPYLLDLVLFLSYDHLRPP